MNRTAIFTQAYLRTDLPAIKPGMVVKVWQKFTDTLTEVTKAKKTVKTQKEIVKPFQGIILACKNGRGISGSFTVRGEVAGQAVEKIFPLHSPSITKIEVQGTSKTRRAKLYFLRDLPPHKIRRKLRTKYQKTV